MCEWVGGGYGRNYSHLFLEGSPCLSGLAARALSVTGVAWGLREGDLAVLWT